MKYTIILLLFLTGCTTIGMIPKFPEVPETLTEPCSKLKEVKNDAKASDFLNVVTENYSEYYQCSEKVSAWNDWYKQQKENHEKLNKAL